MSKRRDRQRRKAYRHGLDWLRRHPYPHDWDGTTGPVIKSGPWKGWIRVGATVDE